MVGLSVLPLVAGLGGCGFRPVFDKTAAHGGASAALAQIEIAPIGERGGQLLREALQRRFEGTGAVSHKAYELVVSYRLDGEGVGIEFGTSSPSRVRLTGTASWRLIALDGEAHTLATGFVKSTDGYNTIDPQFFYSDLQSEQTIRRISENISDQMLLEVSAYFNKAPASE